MRRKLAEKSAEKLRKVIKMAVNYEEVHIPVNPNLPPWILSPKEERLVTDRWQKVSQEKCDGLIKKYIECTNVSKNPLVGIKNCKGINAEVQACLQQYKTIKYYDEQ